MFLLYPKVSNGKVKAKAIVLATNGYTGNCSMGVRGEHRNVYYAFGYSGHGVTAANIAGQVLTDLYSHNHERWHGMRFINADFAAVPLEPFRWLGYQMMTRLTAHSPREPHW